MIQASGNGQSQCYNCNKKGDGKVAKYKIKALEEEIRDLKELLGE